MRALLLIFIASVTLFANTIQVDLRKKRVYLLNDKHIVVSTFKCLGGTRKHPTPKGTFKILQKNKDHRSNKYPKRAIKAGRPGAHMRNFVRITWTGVGFHSGSIARRSHGCIHLRFKDSKKLFKFSNFNTKVIIK